MRSCHYRKFGQRRPNPVNTQRRNNVAPTSMRRHNVEATSEWRYYVCSSQRCSYVDVGATFLLRYVFAGKSACVITHVIRVTESFGTVEYIDNSKSLDQIARVWTFSSVRQWEVSPLRIIVFFFFFFFFFVCLFFFFLSSRKHAYIAYALYIYIYIYICPFVWYASRKHTHIILTPPPPLNPLLYSKTGVYSGIHYFSYFCSNT